MDTKKFIIICASILGGFLLLLLIVWLISLTRPKYITYEELEKKMISASKNYVKDNESKFTTDNAKYNLGYQSLVAGEYIKPLDELLEDSTNCAASVTISKNSGEYSYVPYLNCGERYRTIELYKQVLNDNQVTNNGSGLYRANNGGYYFRGKNLNNYVAFGTVKKNSTVNDYIWQILSISSDGTLKLRATFTENTIKTRWDDRFNEDSSKFVGYNIFNDSLLQEKLEELYKDKDFLNNELKSKLVSRHLCVAPRSAEDESQDGSTECSKKTEKIPFGLLQANEYSITSIDPDCKHISDYQCTNYNYLMSLRDFWSITALADDSYSVFRLSGVPKVTEGSEYGKAGKGFLRINLATSLENVQNGLKRLKKGIENYRKRFQ